MLHEIALLALACVTIYYASTLAIGRMKHSGRTLRFDV